MQRFNSLAIGRKEKQNIEKYIFDSFAEWSASCQVAVWSFSTKTKEKNLWLGVFFPSIVSCCVSETNSLFLFLIVWLKKKQRKRQIQKNCVTKQMHSIIFYQFFFLPDPRKSVLVDFISMLRWLPSIAEAVNRIHNLMHSRWRSHNQIETIAWNEM